MLPRKSHHKGFSPRTKPINKIGKGGRRGAKQNRENKARNVQLGIDRCLMCSSDSGLSNSHTVKEDRRLESAVTALLCIWPCHQFLELKCSAEERAEVNSFLIESDLDPEYRMEAALALLPKEKADKWRKQIYDKRIS